MTAIPFFAQEGEMFLKNLSNEAKSKQIKNVLNLVMFLGMTLLFITGASAIIWRLNLQRIPAITAGVPFFWIVSQFIQALGFFFAMHMWTTSKTSNAMLRTLFWILGLAVYCLPGALYAFGIF